MILHRSLFSILDMQTWKSGVKLDAQLCLDHPTNCYNTDFPKIIVILCYAHGSGHKQWLFVVILP